MAQRVRRRGGRVGRVVRLDCRPTTIIGVLPQGFVFPDGATQLYVALALSEEQLENRRNHFLAVIARLSGDASESSAQAEVDAIARRMAPAYPETNRRVGVTVEPLAEHFSGAVRPALLRLVVAVALVLSVPLGAQPLSAFIAASV